jgi:hypothetical protein
MLNTKITEFNWYLVIEASLDPIVTIELVDL